MGLFLWRSGFDHYPSFTLVGVASVVQWIWPSFFPHFDWGCFYSAVDLTVIPLIIPPSLWLRLLQWHSKFDNFCLLLGLLLTRSGFDHYSSFTLVGVSVKQWIWPLSLLHFGWDWFYGAVDLTIIPLSLWLGFLWSSGFDHYSSITLTGVASVGQWIWPLSLLHFGWDWFYGAVDLTIIPPSLLPLVGVVSVAQWIWQLFLFHCGCGYLCGTVDLTIILGLISRKGHKNSGRLHRMCLAGHVIQ